jgi:hypothetical protein
MPEQLNLFPDRILTSNKISLLDFDTLTYIEGQAFSLFLRNSLKEEDANYLIENLQDEHDMYFVSLLGVSEGYSKLNESTPSFLKIYYSKFNLLLGLGFPEEFYIRWYW